jgi:hypothetical protein
MLLCPRPLAGPAEAMVIKVSRVGGLVECPAMGAYVKVKFVLIRVMVGELCSYTQTIGPSDNDFFMNQGLTIIVQNKLDVKDITNVYRDVLSEDKTYSLYG